MYRRQFLLNGLGLVGTLLCGESFKEDTDILDYFTILNGKDFPCIWVETNNKLKLKGWLVKDNDSNNEVFVPSILYIANTREDLWNELRKYSNDCWKFNKSYSKKDNFLIMNEIKYNGKVFLCQAGVYCNVRYIRKSI